MLYSYVTAEKKNQTHQMRQFRVSSSVLATSTVTFWSYCFAFVVFSQLSCHVLVHLRAAGADECSKKVMPQVGVDVVKVLSDSPLSLPQLGSLG